MATLMVSEDLSGMDEFDCGNIQVYWIDIHVSAVGNDVHRLTPQADLDRYARLGWVSFGYGEENPDDEFRTFWRAPIWIEFLDFHWTPIPQYFGGDFSIWTNRMRWSLSPGATAHIWVWGNT